jgi:hypothetical protein
MKTRLLIIIAAITIGVIVALTIGTLEYQSVYNQNHNELHLTNLQQTNSSL